MIDISKALAVAMLERALNPMMASNHQQIDSDLLNVSKKHPELIEAKIKSLRYDAKMLESYLPVGAA